jgi:hypothetical protein
MAWQLFYFFLLFFVFVGSRIRPGSEMKKIRIWDKHPAGSATLEPTEESCELTSDA